MPKLNATLVDRLFAYCSFRKSEDTDGAVVTEGVRLAWWGFHPDRLKESEELIRHFVLQLPKQFREEKDGGGGGWSFLNACMTAEDVQWGEHEQMEELIMLAMACKLMRPFAGRSLAKTFPGEMPFYTINSQPGREMTTEGYKAWQLTNAQFLFKLMTGFNPNTADQQFHHWYQARVPSAEEVQANTKIDHFTGLLSEEAVPTTDAEVAAQPGETAGLDPDHVMAHCPCGATIGMNAEVALEAVAEKIDHKLQCPKCKSDLHTHIYAAVLHKACLEVIPGLDGHIKKDALTPAMFTDMWMARAEAFRNETEVQARDHYIDFTKWVADRMPNPEHIAVNEAYRAQMSDSTFLMKLPASLVGKPVPTPEMDKQDDALLKQISEFEAAAMAGYRRLSYSEIIQAGDEFAATGDEWIPVSSEIGRVVGDIVCAVNNEQKTTCSFRRKLPAVVTEEYRMLAHDEVLQEGDEFAYGGGSWSPVVGSFGESIMVATQGKHLDKVAFRRKASAESLYPRANQSPA